MLDDLIREAQAVVESFGFIRAVADLDRTDNALRFRLIIDETMFIPVYAECSLSLPPTATVVPRFP